MERGRGGGAEGGREVFDLRGRVCVCVCMQGEDCCLPLFKFTKTETTNSIIVYAF